MNFSFANWVRAYARQALYGTLVLLGCAQALAQEQQLQEVTVTAQRREQNIQNVPIAITAFTGDALQDRNLTDIHSLTNLTSGVNLDAGSPFSGDRSVLSASIRGIGQDDFAFNLNPGVGVYLDGIFLARTIGANQTLLDVDRIEVLKGPQGTLFGANTIGGAISIVTHTPGDTPKFTATATGGEYNLRNVAFTADIPIIPGVLLSTITASSQNQDGWVTVKPYPTSSPQGATPYVVDPQTSYPKAGYATNDNYGGTGVTTIRGKMLWKYSDKLNVTFTGDWTHQDQTALPYTILGVYQGNLGASTFSTLYNLCISNSAASLPAAIGAAGGPPPFVQPINSFFASMCTRPRAQVPGLSTGGTPLIGAGYVGGPPGPYNAGNTGGGPYLGSSQPRLWFNYDATNTGSLNTTYATGPDFARNDNFGGSVTAVYDLGNEMTLKSISGYRQIKWNIGTDLDGTPETLQEVTDAQHQWQVSQEFQLLGKALDNKLNYVGGLYYFKEAGYVHDYVPFESLLYVYDISNNVQNENYAAFFHGDYQITDALGFTAGARYTEWKTNFLGGQSDLNNFPVGIGNYSLYSPNDVTRYFPAIPDSQTWHIVTPSVGLQWRFNPNVMAYTSWGKGFKAGGWTTRLSAVIQSPAEARFSPEYSKTWEVGLKSEWLDHTLLANAALYYTQYDGIQLNVQKGISPVYTNAGNADIKGAELDLKWLVGAGLQLNVAADYIDAYYTEVTPTANFPQTALPDGTTVCPAGPPICGVQGNGGSALDARLPKTPKYKVAFFPQYDYYLASKADLRLMAAFTYTAEMYNDSLNTPQLRRPPTRMLDAQIHYISPDAMYDFSVGGSNLTNDRYPTAGSPNYGAGEVGAYFNPPRMWYASLTVKLTH